MNDEQDNDFRSPPTGLNQVNHKGSSEKASDDKKQILEHGTADEIGYWGSVTHIVRTAVGTGILILPLEMKNLGYITGTLLLLAVSVVYFHILHILLYLDSRLKERFKLKRLSYDLLVDKIFLLAPSPICKCRTSLLCIIYIYYIVPISEAMTLIIISNNIQQMAKYNGSDLNFMLVITSLTIVLTIFCMFKSLLKILVPFSSASNLCSFAIAIIIIVYTTIYRNPKAVVRPFCGDISLVLRGMAVYLNSVITTEIILPLRNRMIKPQKMGSVTGTLNVSAFIIIIFNTSFALLAYINLGDSVQENVLSNIPVGNLLILTINLVYSLALTVPYVLSFYVSLDVLWTSKLQNHLADSKYKYIAEYGIRLGYNALAYFLAVGVSNLALISAIAGVFSILLDVAFMPFLQLLLMYELREKNYWMIGKSILLFAFSSVLFCLSMIDCVNEIVKLYAS